MLKNILSLLLSKFYSKQESEAVGHQAMPSTQNVALTPTTTSIDGWGAVYNGVAPTDGFACIRFTADTATCIASAQTQNVNGFTTPQVVGDILLCACPVAKGQVFTLCARQAKNIECWFAKTIVGGGYQAIKNALLQGGVLCRLKHLYSSLRRSSLSARRNGSATSLKPSYQGVRKSPLSLAPILKTTQRRATELYVSILLTLRGQSSALLLISGLAYFTARTKLEFIKRLRFLSQRVKRSTLTSQRIKAPLVSSSFRPSVLNEVKGGASC